MAAWTLHGACVGEEAGAWNLVLCRVKWLQPAMKSTSWPRRFPYTLVFCSWKSWIVLEWLIQGCASDLSAGFLSFGVIWRWWFSFIIFFSASKSCFFALAPRPSFGAAISGAVVRSSIVFSNSAAADRNVMAASTFLAAAAVCVIPLSFAAACRELYWSGCTKAATVICQKIFQFWRWWFSS